MSRSVRLILSSGAVACLLVLVLAFWLWRGRTAPEVPDPVASRPAVVGTHDRAAGHVATGPGSAVANRPEVVPSPAVPSTTPCGHDPAARVQTAPSARIQPDGSPSAALVDTTAAALQGSARPEAQALGVWLGSIAAQQAAGTALAHRLDACGDHDPACQAAAFTAQQLEKAERGRAGNDALARLASQSGNPVVYAMAFEACRGGSAPRAGRAGHCQLITAERWAQLDSDNMVPWLHLAADAQARQDPAGIEAALYRAGQARASLLYGDALVGLVMPVLQDLPQAERLALAWQVVGVQAEWTFPSFTPLTRHCSEDALRDTNRRQLCNRVGEVLLARGTSMLERGIAISLGKRLGWPEERLARLRTEQKALYTAYRQDQAPTDATSCAALQRGLDWMLQVASHGEIGAARDRILASGQTLEALAAQTDARIQQATMEAAAAASAAAAAIAASAARATPPPPG